MTIRPGLLGATWAKWHASDSHFSQVVCNAHFDGTNGSTTFTNNCPRGVSTLSAHGTAQLSTATPNTFGTAALSVTGVSTSYADSGVSGDYNIGSNDFFIEMWFRTASVASNIALFEQTGATTNKLGIFISGSKLLVRYALSGVINSAVTLSNNTWTSIAVGRIAALGVNNCNKCWINGVIENGVAGGGVIPTAAQTFVLGQDPNSNFFTGFNGLIDEFRFTNGFCRYQGNYTPQTTTFPDA